jgi:hypothetical protein
MYLQSGKAYFAVWFPADCLSVWQMFAFGSLALRVRRLPASDARPLTLRRRRAD